MKKKHNFTKLLSVVLPILMLITSLLPVYAEGSELLESNYDYEKPGSAHNKLLNSADILERVTGESLGEAERAYLVSYGDLTVGYDDGITTAKVTAILDEGKLTVSAYPYTYESSSGTKVSWTPVKATLKDATKELVLKDDRYVAEFEGVEAESGIEKVDVLYIFNVTIAEEEVLKLLNKAKNDIPSLEEEIAEKTAEYNTALADYNLARADYLAFLMADAEYKTLEQKYGEYLSELKIYNEKLEKYNEYIADKAEYETALALYEEYKKELEEYKAEYALYTEYLALKKEYDTALSEYNDYLKTVGEYRNRFEIIEFSARTMTPLGRSALAAINGSTVTSVLEERETLESNTVGAPPQVITLAGEATDQLRILLNGYFSYTTEQGKYGYYLQNYEAFKSGFVNLFISLDYLYRNTAVRAALYDTDRDEKYRILVAQLYLIAHGLSDEPIKSVPESMVAGSKDADKYKQFTYTKNYTMDSREYTVSEILYGEELLEDKKCGTPFTDPFPSEVAAPGEAPEEVLKPDEPAYVSAPAEPAFVADPGEAPEAVADPGEAPEAVPDPGEAPEEYNVPKEYTDLIAVKDSLTEREANFSGDYVLTLEKNVSKKFVDMEEVNVKFYSENGAEMLYEITVDAGTGADYEGEIPVKAEDDRAVYTFAGWQNDVGEKISLSEVNGDLILYPYFEETVKNYTVTFDFEGREETHILPYGATPVYESEISYEKFRGNEVFEFVGWDKPVGSVTGNIRYEAVFEKEYLAPSNQGKGASVSITEDGIVIDYVADISASDSTLALPLAFELAKRERCGLKLITAYMTLDLSYSMIAELSMKDAHTVRVSVAEYNGTDHRVDIYDYKAEILNSEGVAIDADISVGLLDQTAPLGASERLKLFYLDGEGKRRYTKFSLEGGGLSFEAKMGTTYTLAYEYTVTAAGANDVVLAADREIYSAGESVHLRLEVPDGMRLTRLYYTDKDGNVNEFKTASFYMPASDVTVVCEVEYIRYRVSFVSEDSVISSVRYKKGEMPAEPEIPIKNSDGAYNYLFKGWSEEITEVDGEKIYYAVFEAVPIEEVQEPEGGFSFYDKAVLIACIVGGALLLFIAIGVAAALGRGF